MENRAEVFELYNTVLNSPEYNQKKQSIDYLAHFFVMLDSEFNESGNWQIGFYNKEEDMVIVFELMQDKTINMTESKPLKLKEHHVVGELALDEVKMEFNDAIERLRQVMKEKYPSESAVKIIVLLQELENLPVWNLTVVTSTYNTLNVKLDAKNNKVIDHSLSSLLSWGTQQE
ncbi:hypothetical protein KY340_03495 [Candidatus Woesearchaeota archaeon]|nr:hypothetical protein [Candidatus Woesearchaeota archaeon]